MIKNVTKQRLLDGETVVGCFVRSAYISCSLVDRVHRLALIS